MRFLATLLASFIGSLFAIGFLLFLGFILIIGIALTSDPTPTVRANTVLNMDVSGTFAERVTEDPFMQLLSARRSIGVHDVKLALRKAAVDDRIAGVWLQTTGLTDSWARLHDLRNALLEFKESGKPLIAYAGTNGFSEKDYFVASAADSIFAPPESMFEFNGMFVAAQFLTEMFNKIGVDVQYVRAGAYKSAVEAFARTDLSDEAREQIEDMLGQIGAAYYAALSQSRGIPVDSLQSLAERTLTRTEEALAAGLIDGIAYEDEMLDRARAWTDQRPDEELRDISLRSYIRVPAARAGLPEGRRGTIAVVYAEGAIMSGESRNEPNPIFGGQVVGADTFVEAMREARRDDDIDAIVVRIASPGGSMFAADVMWREMEVAAAEKPLIVSMGRAAASGGYYIAAPADTIVAEPLTITGSIGVYSILLTARELMEDKLGLTYETVRTAPHADMYSGLRRLDQREMEILAGDVDSAYERFLDRVSDGRNMTRDEVHDVAQGRIWMGPQAVELGLVDVIGDLRTAINIAAERAGLEPDTFRLRELPRERSFLEQVTQALEARAVNSLLRFTTSPAERMILQNLGEMRHVTELHGMPQARLPLILTD